MPRKDPGPAPQWRAPTTETYSVEVTVVTPMFGGGHTPGVVDELYPIRASAIRGQLRFWWRALYGGSFDSSEDLYDRESRLWGSESQQGAIALTVHVVDKGHKVEAGRYDPDSQRPGHYRQTFRPTAGFPAYALQPFQGKVERGRMDEPPAEGRLDVRFRLQFRTEAAWVPQLAGAVTAWLKYGGMGARTRRGCGSLGWKTADWLSLPKPMGEADEQPAELTGLQGAQAVWGQEGSNPVKAWAEAVSLYRDFRQGEGVARSPGDQPNRPGRSWWPEPDSLRRLLDSACHRHQPIHRVHSGFPRADLGLPIIFHFQDERGGCPPDCVLQGPRDGLRRFASPVITKAIQVSPGRFRPLILVLSAPRAWHFGDLDLKCPDRNASRRVSAQEVEMTPQGRRDTRPLAGQSPREALLDYAARQASWQRVSL